jgi:voltage-gated potassium channel
MDSFFKVIILPITVFLMIIAGGTFGYMFLNHISFLDALELVVTTLSTCGLRSTATVTKEGKIFDIVFIIVSFTVMISVLSKTFSLVVEGQIKGIREREKMKKDLQKMKDHYIVCGFGRVGKQVISQLKAKSIPVVIIDSNPQSEEKLQAEKAPYLIGTISSDEVLRRAHIEKAKGLVACADSDVENVFVTLSARTINPGLNIVARASNPANEDKMKNAGANHVISPYAAAGQKIAGIILNPSVADFLDRAMHDQNVEVWFRELKIPRHSKLIGKTLQELNMRKKVGIIILAIKHVNGCFDLSPYAKTTLQSEDNCICLGSDEQIDAFKKLL